MHTSEGVQSQDRIINSAREGTVRVPSVPGEGERGRDTRLLLGVTARDMMKAGRVLRLHHTRGRGLGA